ncbi:Bifunctional methylenetetrahydrofolate dehydrogenase/methenyltetrahydrofolate cyclohydrolase FolD [Aphelenchoides fujianensis]|nr:Bifunctional methylenetetrahydrofolate dehydrogenase/methenyltetrahydrofolate cyclohydrolase FolD [Aphelenchoides fujianensis]
MAQAKLIDGKAFAADLRARIAGEVAELKAKHGLTPGLAVVLVGEDPASQVYVRNKGQQTEEAGMYSETHRLPAETTQDELLAVVAKLNADPKIHGVLVQFPVPAHISQMDVVAALSPDKDVDGLTDTLGDLSGKNAVVIGRSNLMGKPMAQMLLAADCTVTIAHSCSKDLPGIVRQADIVVAAVGRAEMVKADWIKPGATVIDVGITRYPARDPAAAAAGKTRLVGDVAFDEVREVAGAITPVPGGVGPMTIACLLANTLTAAKRLSGIA